MLAFIVLFLPAVLSLWIYEVLSKKEMPLKKLIYRYSINVVIINLLCFLIKCYVLSSGTSPLLFDGKQMLPVNAFNYLLLALPIAILIAFVESVVSKKTAISVEEVEDEKEGR